jgi:hypothetical protein
MRYEKDEKIYIYNTWNYIYTLYQTIESLSNISDDEEFVIIPSFIEIVYKMAVGSKSEINNLCTGMIKLYGYEKPEIKTNTLKMFKYREDEKKFRKFLSEFHKRINKKDCQFTSLAISYKDYKTAHRNMLLIYIERISIYIYVSLYEPHGYDSFEYPKFCRLFDRTV